MRSLLKILILIGIACFLGFIIFVYAYFEPYISSQSKLLNYKNQGITLTDRNDVPFFYLHNAQKDEYIPLSDISPYLGQAIISTEDKNFYHHFGISPEGIVRSILLNIRDRSFSYGGSTLTQQLVKNTLLSPQKSLIRKAEEAVLAIDLDARYSKNKILEMYINTIYYGDGAIGIKEASSLYFGKEPKDLNLQQAAYLAGMLKYPSLFSPYTGDVTKGMRVQKTVLQNMVKTGMITNEMAARAQNAPLEFKRGNENADTIAPHFALMVEDKLKEMYGSDVVYEGLKVKTSLDLNWQKYAQDVLTTGVDANANNGVTNGSVVAVNPSNGDILVLVGSKDWNNDKYGRVNMATSPRQPGSSFKPIVYSLALDSHLITPASVLKDLPKKYILSENCQKRNESECTYSPHDFDNRYRGPVTARRALANSLNIPAVEVMDKVGADTLLLKSPEFGITTLKDPSYYGRGLSLVLGSAEIPAVQMANAYSVFANEGKRPDPTMILEIRDKFGKLKYKSHTELHEVISPESAYLITSILSDNKARQEEFGNLLSTPFNAAVKTGTTENFRDAWTIGYTPHLVVAVWVGNNNAKPIYNLPGSLAAAPIWKKIIEKLATSSLPFHRPNNIVQATYCDSTSSGSAKIDYFINGTQPPDKCPENFENLNTTIANSYKNSGENEQIPIEISPEEVTITPTQDLH